MNEKEGFMMKHCATITALIAVVFLSAASKCTKEKQTEPVVPKEKVALWNGKDFTGWKFFGADKQVDASTAWLVKDGIICCQGEPKGCIRTEADYANYHLHVEWRWPQGKGGNSGVLLHTSGPDKVWPRSIECQLYSTNAGDFWVINGVEFKEHADKGKRVTGRRTKKLKDSSEKPLGEWNVYEIICKDDWIVVIVNGVLQNVATGMSATSGRICLQSEGTPIEFRNIYIEPLE